MITLPEQRKSTMRFREYLEECFQSAFACNSFIRRSVHAVWQAGNSVVADIQNFQTHAEPKTII
jgi:hypothetical protein